MFQIHYMTPTGKAVILYPKSEREIKSMLQKLAYRHIDSNLHISSEGTRRCGGTEPLDDGISYGKYTWWYERGSVEMRV